MAIVKSNLCKQCGGLLDIDLDRQVYICPFCGVTFDYEYFREDNVKELARKAMKRNEFGAAKDAYEFMLKKDPHDFEALRGLFLCDNRWRTIHSIANTDNIRFKADDKVLANACDNCLPKDKFYFEKIKEAAQLVEDYRENRRQLKKTHSEKDKNDKHVTNLREAYYLNDHRFSLWWEDFCEIRDGKGGRLVVDLGILAVVILGYSIYAFQWWVPIMLAVGIGIYAISYNIHKGVVKSQLNTKLQPATQEAERLSEEIKAKNVEGEKLMSAFRMKVREIMEEDPLPQEEPAEINH